MALCLLCIAKSGATIISELTQIIYASQPFGYDSATLSGILLDARRCNLRDDVTGALVCRHDIYLQLIEGPTDKIRATYERILRDDRHTGIDRLVDRPITNRMFGDWAMLHDPEKTLIWTKDKVSDGSIKCTPPTDIIDMFQNISGSVRTA